MKRPWLERIDIPDGINTLCSPARVSTMRAVFGGFDGVLTSKCKEALVPERVERGLVTWTGGNLRVRGYHLFVDTLKQVLAQYEDRFPGAWDELTTAGCLCCRLVRGSRATPSNHSWGTAIDLGFNSAIDVRGDGRCYRGLLDLYSVAKGHLLYWGASYSVTDPMHFEASEELVRHWRAKGMIS